jgi:hypothetical protein
MQSAFPILRQSFPAGDARNQLLEEISALDVIAEMMRRAMEGMDY